MREMATAINIFVFIYKNAYEGLYLLSDELFCLQRFMKDEAPIPGILFHYPIKLCLAVIIHY